MVPKRWRQRRIERASIELNLSQRLLNEEGSLSLSQSLREEKLRE